MDDLPSEPCHAPKFGKGSKSTNAAPTYIGRSVHCLSEKNGIAVRLPYVYRYTLLIPDETNASLHSFAGLFETAVVTYHFLSY